MNSGQEKNPKFGGLTKEQKEEVARAIHDNPGLALMIGNVRGAPLGYTVIELEKGVEPWNTGFGDEHFDMVAVAGTLEKQPRNGVLRCVGEWRRILKPAGRLDLLVPNLRWACISLVRGEFNEDWPGILATLYGTQENEAEFHRTGFTLQMLRALLEGLGFTMKKATLAPWEIMCGENTIQAEYVYLQAVKVGI